MLVGMVIYAAPLMILGMGMVVSVNRNVIGNEPGNGNG